MTPGDCFAAELHGIVTGWPVSAMATVLDLVPVQPTGILLAITSTIDAAHFHATGITSSPLHDGPPVTVDRLATTGLQPTRIVLLRPVQFGTSRPAASALDASRDEAYSALAPYLGSVAPGGPLTDLSLPMLDRAVRTLAERRERAGAAEAGRDDLIRRFLAGGVLSGALRTRTGLSASSISLIKNRPTAVPAPIGG